MTSAESLTNHTLYYVPARWRTHPPSLLTSAAAWFDEAQPVGADGWTGTAMPTSHQQSSLYSPCRRDLEREGGPLRGEDKKGPHCRLSRSISAAQLRSDGWERRRGGRYFIYRPPSKSVRDGKLKYEILSAAGLAILGRAPGLHRQLSLAIGRGGSTGWSTLALAYPKK